MTLTHLDEYGRAHMVDVGHKHDTQREAVARGTIEVADLVHARLREFAQKS